MTMENDVALLFDKVREIISEQLNVLTEKITFESCFSDDFGADSLDLFQIISELEDLFDISFTNESADGIKTVGDAVMYIKARI